MSNWHSWRCFRCGEPGHVKADCPQPHPPRKKRPPAPPPPSAPDEWKAPAETPCQSARRRIIYFGQGRQTRAAMGWGTGPLVQTPFREASGIAPKFEGQLRAEAARQVSESRGQRHIPAGAGLAIGGSIS